VCPTEVSSVDRKRSLEHGQASEPEGTESLFLRPGYCRQEVKSEAVRAEQIEIEKSAAAVSEAPARSDRQN